MRTVPSSTLAVGSAVLDTARARRVARAASLQALRAVLPLLGAALVLAWVAAAAWIVAQLVSWWVLLANPSPLPGGQA